LYISKVRIKGGIYDLEYVLILAALMVALGVVLSSCWFSMGLGLFSRVEVVFFYDLGRELNVFKSKSLYCGKVQMSYMETLDFFFFMYSMTLYSMGYMVGVLANVFLVVVVLVADFD
jgi:hypothetical protein